MFCCFGHFVLGMLLWSLCAMQPLLLYCLQYVSVGGVKDHWVLASHRACCLYSAFCSTLCGYQGLLDGVTVHSVLLPALIHCNKLACHVRWAPLQSCALIYLVYISDGHHRRWQTSSSKKSERSKHIFAATQLLRHGPVCLVWRARNSAKDPMTPDPIGMG